MPTRRKATTTAHSPELALFAEWLADTFVIPSGISRGEAFTLHDFQAEYLAAVLEREGPSPRYRTAVFSTPRKQGKSSLLAAYLLGRFLPDSPLHMPRCRAAIAAPTAKHAEFIGHAARDIMEAAGREAEFRLAARPAPGAIIAGDGQATLMTGARNSGHGADLDIAVIDEAGLLPRRQSELITNFFDALAAKDGQLLVTGTRGDSPEYNRLIEEPDRRTFVCCYGASLEDDASDPAVWRKANPGLGTIKSERFMADAYEKALASGSDTAFRAWHLNMPLSPQRELLVDHHVLAGCYRTTVDPVPGEPVHIGLDLGGAASMTAACLAYESGAVRVLGAFPGAAMPLAERGVRDHVGDLWTRCHEAGELHLTSGSVTDVPEFLSILTEAIGPHPVASLSCDRYRREELLTALARVGIVWPVVFRGTGPRDGDADIRATRKALLSRSLFMRRSLLLEGSIGEADVRTSATGACQLDKSHPNARIDVAQSLCLAASAWVRAKESVPPSYEIEVV